MRVEQRTVYIANNGTEFDSEAGARMCDVRCAIAEILCATDIYWRDTSPQEVADNIVKNGKEIAALLTVIKE